MLDSDIRRWVVHESADRWIRAIRRFGPAMTPEPLVLDVVRSESPTISEVLIPNLPAIVLWEALPGNLATIVQRLRQTHDEFPHLLQLIADGGLFPSERSLLSEFPVALILQNPEQLPRLKPLVEGHFASASQLVD